MNFLLIDGASNKICFFSHFNNNSYNQSFEGSKNNYEKFSILLFDFLNQNNINLNKLSHLFVNQGPGSFSGIRTSIAVAKGLSITNKLNLVSSSKSIESGSISRLEEDKYCQIYLLVFIEGSY